MSKVLSGRSEWWRCVTLGWMQFRLNWSSGETKVLWLVIVLSLTLLSSVFLLNTRLAAVIQQQGSSFIGGDAQVTGQRAMPSAFLTVANQLKLVTAQTFEFPSMMVVGEATALVEIKAVPHHFPLSGHLVIADGEGKKQVQHGPSPGQVWLEPTLMRTLNLKLGDSIQLGDTPLIVSAILHEELSRGGELFSLAPRVLMASSNLPDTHLIQAGSRVKYQLLLSGTRHALQNYQQRLSPSLSPFYRWESSDDGRPELKSLVQKVNQFLGLSACLSLILCVVAMVFISKHYLENSLRTMALYRCLGASAGQLYAMLWVEISLLILSASILGVLIGAQMQLWLYNHLSPLLFNVAVTSLPTKALVESMGSLVFVAYGVLLMMFFPLLRALSAASCLSLIREQPMIQNYLSKFQCVFYVLVLLFIADWFAHSMAITVYFFLGGLILFALTVLSYHGLIAILTTVENTHVIDDKFSLSMIISVFRRRKWMINLQIFSVSLLVMGVVLISFIKTSLIQEWQQRLSPKTPNHFLINVQRDQLDSVRSFLHQEGIEPAFFPMIRARLVAVNQRPFRSENFTDERAKRLADREFNLSMASRLNDDNTIVAGAWWGASTRNYSQISIEQGLAETLHLHLGDSLTFDVAGELITRKMTSLRKVDWGTMHVNFFAICPEGAFSLQNASFIASFYLPANGQVILDRLVGLFPNLTILNIESILQQLNSIITQLTSMLEMVFSGAFLAAALLLYSSFMATREERYQEQTILKVLGCIRGKINRLIHLEFLLIGWVSLLLGYGLACSLALLFEYFVFNLPIYTSIGAYWLPLAFIIIILPFFAFIYIKTNLLEQSRA